MFKLDPNPTFKAKVKIPVPGASSLPSIEFEFRHKTKTELKAFLERIQADPSKEVEQLEEIIVTWSGTDAEYGRDSLARLLDNYPAAGAAIAGAYVRELGDARLGN